MSLVQIINTIWNMSITEYFMVNQKEVIYVRILTNSLFINTRIQCHNIQNITLIAKVTDSISLLVQ